MMQTSVTVQPFSPDEFYQFIRRPEHTNRARMSYEKQQVIRTFLQMPELQPANKLEKDLRSQVHGYRLDEVPTNKTLWRLRDAGHKEDRKVIPSESAFDTITTMHCKHAHPGKNKTFDLIREKYYGITKEEVSYNIFSFYTQSILFYFLLLVCVRVSLFLFMQSILFCFLLLVL